MKANGQKKSVDCYRMKLNLFNLLVKMRNRVLKKKKNKKSICITAQVCEIKLKFAVATASSKARSSV